jgi:hypothetical protein
MLVMVALALWRGWQGWQQQQRVPLLVLLVMGLALAMGKARAAAAAAAAVARATSAFRWSSSLDLAQVRKTPFFAPFTFKMHDFTKTGSGQT